MMRKRHDSILQEFRSVFENEKIVKIGQNIKYDALILKWYDIILKGVYRDTMIAHYLLEPEMNHSMNYLAETYLNYEPVKIESLIGKRGIKQLTMRQADPAKVCEYAAEDADITLQLEKYLFTELTKANLDKLYQDIEEPLIKVLTDLEYAGVNLNQPFLAEYSQEIQKEILAKESKIYKQAGTHFNIGSPKQVGEILFDKLGIPYRWRRTKSGQYSTDEDKMTELAAKHEIVADIMQHRMFSKLRSTYVDALPLMVNPKTRKNSQFF